MKSFGPSGCRGGEHLPLGSIFYDFELVLLSFKLYQLIDLYPVKTMCHHNTNGLRLIAIDF